MAQSVSVTDCYEQVKESEFEVLLAVLIVTHLSDMRSTFIYGSGTICH
jgi:hypothetical protein